MFSTILLLVAGFYAALAIVAHVSARFGLHRKIVPVRRQDLSQLAIWGRANPWRIVIHDALTPQQEQWVLGHEWQHVYDYWLTGFFLYSIWKLVDRRRAVLWIESRAYAVSVRRGRPLEDAAVALAGAHYDLDIGVDEARAAIKKAAQGV